MDSFQKTNLYVTYVEKEGPFLKIWGQTDKNNALYVEHFLSGIASQFDLGLGKVSAESVPPGTLICAKYKDQKYYRAKIISNSFVREGFLEVSFIDFGNKEVVATASIRSLQNFPTAIVSLPPLAVGFIFAEAHCVGGGEWNDTIFESIAKEIKYREVQCTLLIQATNYYLVRITADGTDLCALLIQRGLMQPISLQAQQAVLLSMSMQKQQNTQSQSQTSSVSSGINTYKACTLEQGCLYPVYVSYVNDGPCHFSIQLKQTEDALVMLMNEINSIALRLLDDIPIPGTICLAKCQEDNNICRAVVTNEVDTQFKVFYVDFGNYEVLPVDSLYQIPFKYVLPKVMAIRYSLAGVDKSTVTLEMQVAFKKFVDNRLLHMKVLPSTTRTALPKCELWDPETKTSALDVVINSARHSYPEPLALTRGFSQPVKVSFVYSCSRFYVQLVNKESELSSLMEDLQELCQISSQLDANSIKVGAPCCALFSGDGLWYRSQIVEVSGDIAKVRYIDYGNEEAVPVSQLKSIDGEILTVLRPQAIESCLNGYQNMEPDEERDALLEELILENVFSMKVVDMFEKKALVDLFDSSDYNVASLLLDKLAAAKSQVSPVLIVQAGNKIEHRKSYNQQREPHAYNKEDKTSNTGREPRNFEKPYDKNERNEKSWRQDNRDTRNYDKNTNDNNDRNSWRQNNKGFSPNNRFDKNKQSEDSWNTTSNSSNNNQDWENTEKSSPPKTHSNYNSNNEQDTWNTQGDDDDWATPATTEDFRANRKNDFKSNRGDFNNDRGGRFGGKPREGGFQKKDYRKDGSEMSSSGSEKSFQKGPRSSSRIDKGYGGDKGFGGDKSFGGNKSFGGDRSFGGGDKGYGRDKGYGGGKDYGGNKFDKPKSSYRDNKGSGDSWNANSTAEDSWNVSAVTTGIDAAPVSSTFVNYDVVGTEGKVTVTWFHNPGLFFLQQNEFQQAFKTMMDEICELYKGKKPEKVAKGAPVVVLFDEDNVLYRARVLEVMGNQYKVHYIDFGNVSTVSKVWPIDKKFMDLPAQAIPCSLNGVASSSGEWTDPDGYSTYFDKDTFLCQFVNKDEEKTYVNISYNSEDIAQLLIREGLAVSTLSTIPEIELPVLLGQQFRATVKSVNNLSDFILALECGLAVNCTMHNLADATETFEDTLKGLLEQTVIVYVDNVLEDYRLEITLYDTDGNKHVIIEPDEGAFETLEVLCPLLVLRSEITGYVPHADETSIFIQPTENADLVSSLLDQLFEMYDGKPHENTIIPEEEMIYAVHSEDGNWYRGKVISFDDEKATVTYIDYGNSEDVAFVELRELDPSFLSISILSLQVTVLSDAESYIDKTVTANIYLGETGWEGSVQILDSTPTSLPAQEEAAESTDTGIAMSSMENPEGDHVEVSGEDITEKEPVESVTNEQSTVEALPAIGNPIFISHIDSPTDFYLQFAETLNEIEELQAELQEKVAEMEVLENPVPGVLCAAPYSADQQWYRAEVLDADEDITTVRFVDFGNTDVIDNSTTQVKTLPPKLLSLDIYATRCALKIQPIEGEWSSTSLTVFEQLLTGEDNLTAEFFEQDEKCTYVELYVNGINVKDSMVAENLAKHVVKSAEVKQTGFVSHLNSPSEFWIQLESCVDELEWIAEQLSSADSFPDLEDQTPGTLCAALFSDDQMWYRARILSNTVAGVELLFIDYGNSCTSSSLKQLPEELVITAPLALKCSLQKNEGIPSWSPEAAAKFEEISADGQTIFAVKKISTGETCVVQLLLDGQDVTTMLLPSTEEGCVTEIKSLEELTIRKEDGTEVDEVALEPLEGQELDDNAKEKFEALNEQEPNHTNSKDVENEEDNGDQSRGRKILELLKSSKKDSTTEPNHTNSKDVENEEDNGDQSRGRKILELLKSSKKDSTTGTTRFQIEFVSDKTVRLYLDGKDIRPLLGSFKDPSFEVTVVQELNTGEDADNHVEDNTNSKEAIEVELLTEHVEGVSLDNQDMLSKDIPQTDVKELFKGDINDELELISESGEDLTLEQDILSKDNLQPDDIETSKSNSEDKEDNHIDYSEHAKDDQDILCEDNPQPDIVDPLVEENLKKESTKHTEVMLFDGQDMISKDNLQSDIVDDFEANIEDNEDNKIDLVSEHVEDLALNDQDVLSKDNLHPDIVDSSKDNTEYNTMELHSRHAEDVALDNQNMLSKGNLDMVEPSENNTEEDVTSDNENVLSKDNFQSELAEISKDNTDYEENKDLKPLTEHAEHVTLDNQSEDNVEHFEDNTHGKDDTKIVLDDEKVFKDDTDAAVDTKVELMESAENVSLDNQDMLPEKNLTDIVKPSTDNDEDEEINKIDSIEHAEDVTDLNHTTKDNAVSCKSEESESVTHLLLDSDIDEYFKLDNSGQDMGLDMTLAPPDMNDTISSTEFISEEESVEVKHADAPVHTVKDNFEVTQPQASVEEAVPSEVTEVPKDLETDENKDSDKPLHNKSVCEKEIQVENISFDDSLKCNRGFTHKEQVKSTIDFLKEEQLFTDSPEDTSTSLDDLVSLRKTPALDLQASDLTDDNKTIENSVTITTITEAEKTLPEKIHDEDIDIEEQRSKKDKEAHESRIELESTEFSNDSEKIIEGPTENEVLEQYRVSKNDEVPSSKLVPTHLDIEDSENLEQLTTRDQSSSEVSEFEDNTNKVPLDSDGDDKSDNLKTFNPNNSEMSTNSFEAKTPNLEGILSDQHSNLSNENVKEVEATVEYADVDECKRLEHEDSTITEGLDDFTDEYRNELGTVSKDSVEQGSEEINMNEHCLPQDETETITTHSEEIGTDDLPEQHIESSPEFKLNLEKTLPVVQTVKKLPTKTGKTSGVKNSKSDKKLSKVSPVKDSQSSHKKVVPQRTSLCLPKILSSPKADSNEKQESPGKVQLPESAISPGKVSPKSVSPNTSSKSSSFRNKKESKPEVEVKEILKDIVDLACLDDKNDSINENV